MGPKARKRARLRAAARAPEWVRHVATTKAFAKGRRQWRAPVSRGAASPVRRIDPKTGMVIE